MTSLTFSPSTFETAALRQRVDGVPAWHTESDTDDRSALFSAQPSTLTLELVEDRLGFNALEAEWTDLFARAGRPQQLFQSFGWLWHWCNHFLDPHDSKQSLAIVTGRRNGILVLVCPFVATRSAGLTTLAFMGDPVSQYGDVLLEEGPQAAADLEAAFDFALERTKAGLVHLRKVRGDACVAGLLRGRGARFTDVQQAPYVAFENGADYSAFEERYPKAARKNRRRQLRRLQDVGPSSFMRLPAGPEASEAASVALRLKRDWLKQRGLVSPAVADARTEAFFRDCASGRGPDSGLEIGLVTAQGEVAAVEIAIQCKTRVAIHLIAYDARFERTGAGALLMEDSIRRACQNGQDALDLLAPGNGYKFEWADRTVDVGDCAFGLSAAGRIYASFYLSWMRPAAKSFVERLPSALRRHLAAVIGAALFLAQSGDTI
jgi:CelD/BcsL family acetyltransferase involved in cellulose biosynthesis